MEHLQSRKPLKCPHRLIQLRKFVPTFIEKIEYMDERISKTKRQNDSIEQLLLGKFDPEAHGCMYIEYIGSLEFHLQFPI